MPWYPTNLRQCVTLRCPRAKRFSCVTSGLLPVDTENYWESLDPIPLIHTTLARQSSRQRRVWFSSVNHLTIPSFPTNTTFKMSQVTECYVQILIDLNCFDLSIKHVWFFPLSSSGLSGRRRWSEELDDKTKRWRHAGTLLPLQTSHCRRLQHRYKIKMRIIVIWVLYFR